MVYFPLNRLKLGFAYASRQYDNMVQKDNMSWDNSPNNKNLVLRTDTDNMYQKDKSGWNTSRNHLYQSSDPCLQFPNSRINTV